MYCAGFGAAYNFTMLERMTAKKCQLLTSKCDRQPFQNLDRKHQIHCADDRQQAASSEAR